MNDWRIRFTIGCFAELPTNCDINGHPSSIRKITSSNNGLRVYVVDIFFKEEDIQSAFYAGWSFAEILVDRVSYLSNSPANLQLIISVCKPSVAVNEEFELLVPQGSFMRSPVSIGAERIAELDKIAADSTEGIALRAFRKGLAENNPFTKYINIYTALDVLIKKEAKGKDLEVKAPCEKCTRGYERPTMPVLTERIMEKETGSEVEESDAKIAADDLRKLRGIIAHGNKLMDHELREKVEGKLGELHTVSSMQIAKSTEVKMASNITPHFGTPITTLSMKRVGDGQQEKDFNMLSTTSFSVKASFANIPARYADKSTGGIFMGLSESQKIMLHPDACPDLAE